MPCLTFVHVIGKCVYIYPWHCVLFVLFRCSESFRRSLGSRGPSSSPARPCTDMWSRPADWCGAWWACPLPWSCASHRASRRTGRTGSTSTGTRLWPASDWHTLALSCSIAMREEWGSKVGWAIRNLRFPPSLVLSPNPNTYTAHALTHHESWYHLLIVHLLLIRVFILVIFLCWSVVVITNHFHQSTSFSVSCLYECSYVLFTTFDWSRSV